MELTIVETTVGDLDGWSAGVANVFDGEADVTLWSDAVPAVTVRVRVGATFRAGAVGWIVVAIREPPRALGSIVVRRLR